MFGMPPAKQLASITNQRAHQARQQTSQSFSLLANKLKEQARGRKTSLRISGPISEPASQQEEDDDREGSLHVLTSSTRPHRLTSTHWSQITAKPLMTVCEWACDITVNCKDEDGTFCGVCVCAHISMQQQVIRPWGTTPREFNTHYSVYVSVRDSNSAGLIFHSVFEMAESSVEKDGDMEGAAAHCLWQEGRERGRRGIETISSLLLLLWLSAAYRLHGGP